MTSVSVHMTVLQQSRLTVSAASHSSCQRNYICTPVQCHREHEHADAVRR